jgi:CTP:molybdopterin cytidylyltransferase MocA
VSGHREPDTGAGNGPAVAGIVLAAGSGSRYGQPKALVRFGTELLVQRACRLLRAGGCEPVLVVLGAQADLVRAAAGLPPAGREVAGLRTVDNPAWATGIGSSVRAGVAAAPATAVAAVVALADEPLVGVEAVRRLIGACRAGLPAGVGAVVATYGGRQRNPVLLTRGVFDAVGAAAQGDTGARAWLRAHPGAVLGVPCDDTGEALDVDTPADLAVALARAERGEN